jgi:GT2 family glycosyltransferase
MTVSVIIVTVRAKDYIRSCLDSLFKQTLTPYEIIVVDNSALTGFAQEINRLYPSVKVISGAPGLFYTGGMNKAIALSAGEFVLCLNDDVILDKEFIRRAYEGFLISQDIGSVSGKILRADGKTLDSTGLFLSAWRTAKERGYGRPDTGQFDKDGYVFGVSGAAAFYRRKMLEEIKEAGDYFDSRFKMFYEDLDLAWRANKKGWRSYYVSGAKIYHVRGGSFRPDSGINKSFARRYLNNQLHYRLIKNRYLTVAKNEEFLGFLLHFIPVLIYEAYVWIYILFFRPQVLKIFLERKRA